MSENIDTILGELPRLLVEQAYKKLLSGVDLTASEMKVCLDICKQYSPENLGEKTVENIMDLPFSEDDGELNSPSH